MFYVLFPTTYGSYIKKNRADYWLDTGPMIKLHKKKSKARRYLKIWKAEEETILLLTAFALWDLRFAHR